MSGRLEHPVLGIFEGQGWEWQAQNVLSFPCTGFSTRYVSIVAPDGHDSPTPEQIQALVDLIHLPASFRAQIASAIFKAYVEEIRPDYLEIEDSWIFPRANLLDVKAAEDIWSVIKELHYVWVNDDASIMVNFSVTFDIEHELRVEMVGGEVRSVHI